jgi:hypothetical protein
MKQRTPFAGGGVIVRRASDNFVLTVGVANQFGIGISAHAMRTQLSVSFTI